MNISETKSMDVCDIKVDITYMNKEAKTWDKQ